MLVIFFVHFLTSLQVGDGTALQSYLKIHRCIVGLHEHCAQSTLVTTGLCQRFVLYPLQTNPIWPWERATAGVSRRAPSQGAPIGHGGITPKLWQGYPPICWGNKCCPIIGHPIDWGNTAVGRRRPSAAPRREGCLVLPSFALSGLFKSCSQHSKSHFIAYLHIYESLFFDSFLSSTLCIEITWDWGQKVRDVVPSWNQKIIRGSAAK